MAPGPPDKFSNNKYYPLGDFMDNPPKRKKGNIFPDLPTPTKHNNNTPKYILISSTDTTKQISKLSPFAIKKGIENITKEFNSISLLRDGSILVLANNTRAAEKFLKSKSLANLCPISCKFHETLNSVKGVIYAPCLIHVQEEEIISKMKEQGVIGVYKFTKPSDDGVSRIPTGKMILTFDLHRLPSTVDVAWYKCKVDHYIPNPMRCKNCQLLGHTKNRCRGITTCPDCSLPPHTPEKCTRLLCINCSGNHSSADNKCPRFTQMREILRIKTINYCSLAEARRKFKESNPTQTNTHNSYAAIVSGTSTNLKESSNHHTSIPLSSTQTENNTQHPPSRSNPFNQNANEAKTTPKNSTKENSAKTTTSASSKKNNITTIENNRTYKSSDTINTIQVPPTRHSTETFMVANSDLDTLSEDELPCVSNLSKLTNSTTTNRKDYTLKSAPKVNSDTLLSPISHLTQSLIKDNDYFVTLSDEESLNEFNMDQSTSLSPKPK